MLEIDEVPTELVAHIAKLRQDAGRYRRQRNGARKEAEALRAELASVMADSGR